MTKAEKSIEKASKKARKLEAEYNASNEKKDCRA